MLARLSEQGGSPRRCQVPSCRQELSHEKTFYRRYRICPTHANLPSLVLSGRVLRFCHLCRRFEDLEAFDGDRKSCRAMLLQHNNRRRKNRHGEASVSGHSGHNEGPTTSPARKKPSAKPAQRASKFALLLGDREGEAGLEPIEGFGLPPLAPHLRLRVPPQADIYSGTPSPDSSSQGLSGGSQQAGEGAAALYAGPMADAAAAAAGAAAAAAGAVSQEMLTDEALAEQLLADPELQAMLCACLPVPEAVQGAQAMQLPWGSPGGGWLPEIAAPAVPGPTPMDPSGFIPMDSTAVALLQVPGSQTSWPAQELAAAPPAVLPAALPHGHSSSLSEAEVMGWAQQSGMQGPLPFEAAFGDCSLPEMPPWQLPPAALPGTAGTAGVALSSAAAGPAAMGPPAFQGGPPEGQLWAAEAAQDAPAIAPPRQAEVAGEASTAAFPLQHVEFPGQPGEPSPLRFEEHMARLSIKLFNVEPSELPSGLLQSIVDVVAKDPVFVDSFVRPGCTQITADVALGAAEWDRLARTGAAGLAQQLLQLERWQVASGASQMWASDMLVQLGDDVAIVREGQQVGILNVGAVAPHLVAARPIAILASGSSPDLPSGDAWPDLRSKAGMRLEDGCVTLWGHGITEPGTEVVCWQNGRSVDVEALDSGRLPGNPKGGQFLPEWLLLRPLGTSVGLLQFEVQRSGMLSSPAALVALPSRDSMAEAQQAYRALAGRAQQKTFLHHLGLLLSQGTQAAAASASADGCMGYSYLNPAHADLLALGLLSSAQAHGWPTLAQLLACAMKQGSGPTFTGVPGIRGRHCAVNKGETCNFRASLIAQGAPGGSQLAQAQPLKPANRNKARFLYDHAEVPLSV